MEESIHINKMELTSKIINNTSISCIIKKASKSNPVQSDKRQCKSIKSSQQYANFEPNISMSFSKNEEKKIQVALAMRNARQLKVIGKVQIDIANISSQSYTIYEHNLKSEPQSKLKIEMIRRIQKQPLNNQFNKHLPTAYDISRKNYKNAEIVRQQHSSKNSKHGLSNRSPKSSYQYRYRVGQQSPVPRQNAPEPIKITNQNVNNNKQSNPPSPEQKTDKYKPITDKLQQIHGIIKQKQADKTLSQLNQSMKSKELSLVNSSLIQQFQQSKIKPTIYNEMKNPLNSTEGDSKLNRSEDFSKILLSKEYEISKIRQQQIKKNFQKEQELLKHIQKLSKLLLQKQQQLSSMRQKDKTSLIAHQQQIIKIKQRYNQQSKNKEKQFLQLTLKYQKLVSQQSTKVINKSDKKKQGEVNDELKQLKRQYDEQAKQLKKILVQLQIQKNTCLEQQQQLIVLNEKLQKLQKLQKIQDNYSLIEKQLKKKTDLLKKMDQQYQKVLSQLIESKDQKDNLENQLKKYAQLNQQKSNQKNPTLKDEKLANNQQIIKYQNKIKLLQQQNAQKIVQIRNLTKRIDQIQQQKIKENTSSSIEIDKQLSALKIQNISLKKQLQQIEIINKMLEIQNCQYQQEIKEYQQKIKIQKDKNQLKDGQIKQLKDKILSNRNFNKENEEIKQLKYQLKNYQLQYKAKEIQNRKMKLQIDDLKMEKDKLNKFIDHSHAANNSMSTFAQTNCNISAQTTKQENEELKKEVKSLQDQLNELIGLFTYMKSNITKMAQEKRQQISKKMEFKEKRDQKGKIAQLRNEIFEKLKPKQQSKIEQKIMIQKN